LTTTPGEFISKSPHGLDEFHLKTAVDLGSKLLHKGIQRVVLDSPLVSLDRINNCVTPKDDVRITHQKLEQQKLRASERDLLPCSRSDVGQRIQFKIFKPVA
jgi:hypothetical protein